MLHDVPDFDERWRFLESLKDRLEALVSPLLITAFNTHNTGMVARARGRDRGRGEVR